MTKCITENKTELMRFTFAFIFYVPLILSLVPMQYIGKLSSTKEPRISKFGANFGYDKQYCVLENKLPPVYHSLLFSI